MDISLASNKREIRSGKYQSELNLRDAKIYRKFSLKRPKSVQKINTSQVDINQLNRPKSLREVNDKITSKRSSLQRVCSFYRSEVQLNRGTTIYKSNSIKRPKSLHCLNAINKEKVNGENTISRSKSFYEKFRSIRRKPNLATTNEKCQSKLELCKSQESFHTTKESFKECKTTPFGVQLHSQTTPLIFPQEDTNPGVRYGYLLDCEDEEEINIFDPKYFRSEFENIITTSLKANKEEGRCYGTEKTFVLTGLPSSNKRKLEHFSMIDMEHSPYSKMNKRRQSTLNATPNRCK